MVVLLVTNVFAAMEPSRPFCEHQGYTFEKLGEGTELKDFYCVFDDENKCVAWDFYEGKCGVEYKKEIPCRKEGELLFSQFEECCEGLESSYGWWNRVIGQPTCIKKLNFFQKLWRWLF